jgi:hypothetical protein
LEKYSLEEGCALVGSWLGRRSEGDGAVDSSDGVGCSCEGFIWRRLSTRGGCKYFTIAVKDLEKAFAVNFDKGKTYKVEYEIGCYTIECVQSFSQKYVEIHIPKRLSENFEEGKLYKIHPVRFKKIGFRTKKRILGDKSIDYEAKIILPKGDIRRARIEVPKSLQKHYGIIGEKTVKVTLETSKERFEICARARERPLNIPVPKKYAREGKVRVKEIKEYTLKEFITEYNQRKPIENISMQLKNNKLKLKIGEHKIGLKKHDFKTYGGKPYLEFEHRLENSTTKYRILKEEDNFKMYRLAGTGYEQITEAFTSKNKIVLITKHGNRTRRHLFYKKEEPDSMPLGDPELLMEEIDNNSMRILATFPKEDFNNIITGLAEFRKERNYAKGTLGERVAEKVLRKLNYRIIRTHKEGSRHPGDDITVLKNSEKAYVEVKYVTNRRRIDYKIAQALQELHNRHLNENAILIAVTITYNGETKFELTLKFQVHSPPQIFFVYC